jgi:Family of unknown function (DUF6082)
MMKLRKLRRRGWILPASATIGMLAALSLVIVSPLALTELNPLSGKWPQLSNIGQTYGAISALISSLALGGVVVSIFFQSRDLRATKIYNSRDVQHRLLRMEMDDPDLMTAIGAPWNLPIPNESKKIREHLYIHMWITHWAGSYAIGEMDDSGVKRIAIIELFKGKPGREYWSNVRSNLIANSRGAYYRFACIIDEAYGEVMKSNTPANEPVKVTGHDSDARSFKATHPYLLAMGTGLTVSIIVWRKLNRRLNY